MNTHRINVFLPLLLTGLFVFSTSTCGAAPPTPVQTPIPLTREVTRLVTQEVTQAVTKIVPVLVTVTPEPTQAPTSTPDPNATPGPASLPRAILPAQTDCRQGPADWFLYQSSFPAGTQVEVVGRSEDGEGLAVQEVGGWNYCWVWTLSVDLGNIKVDALPLAKVILPRSEYEFGSPYTSTRRDGDEVTISWEAIYMSRDEVYGYLFDLELCRDGLLRRGYNFQPVTFDENEGLLSTVFIDEAGCSETSSAHVVTYGRRGFAEWEKIFLPPHP